VTEPPNAFLILLHAHDYLAASRGPDWKERRAAADLCWRALIQTCRRETNSDSVVKERSQAA
jgi:hypothetical protein